MRVPCGGGAILNIVGRSINPAGRSSRADNVQGGSSREGRPQRHADVESLNAVGRSLSPSTTRLPRIPRTGPEGPAYDFDRRPWIILNGVGGSFTARPWTTTYRFMISSSLRRSTGHPSGRRLLKVSEANHASSPA